MCKVLSFDVGIINLAYCIIEIHDNTFKIIEWDIINIAENRKTCQYNNSKKIFDKIAKHVMNIDDETYYYYCKSHICKAPLKILYI